MSDTRPLRRFRPSLVPTLVTFAVLPLLIGLGVWQIDRAEEKRALLESFAAAAELPSLAAALAADDDPDLARFPRLSLRGHYEPQRQFLLDAMSHEGRPGFHVWTPLRSEAGDVLIVNRGWIPQSATRTAGVDIAVTDAELSVSGHLRRFPEPGVRLGSASVPPAETPWPRIVLYPEPAEISAALGTPVAERVLMLDAAAEQGFLRDWAPSGIGPDRHIAYAAQWFGLAAALLIIFIVVNLRPGVANDE